MTNEQMKQMIFSKQQVIKSLKEKLDSLETLRASNQRTLSLIEHMESKPGQERIIGQTYRLRVSLTQDVINAEMKTIEVTIRGQNDDIAFYERQLAKPVPLLKVIRK